LSTSIKKIDDIIHQERINAKKQKVTYKHSLTDLPDGTMILFEDQPYLITEKRIHLWTPFGYKESVPKPKAVVVNVLTPYSIVNAFRSGYAPQIATSVE
jgi:hypothetical protein